MPRLPDEELVKVYKWRLEQNDAQNLGYVLDNFPKNASQAEALFFRKVVKEDESEELVKEDTLVPQSAFMLSHTDEEVREAVKERVPAEELANTRYNEEALGRRLAAYRGNSEGMVDFYEQMQIPLVQGKEVETWVAAIEKDGKIMVLGGEEEEQEPAEKAEGILEEEEEVESKKEEDMKQEQIKKEAQLTINKTRESIAVSRGRLI